MPDKNNMTLPRGVSLKSGPNDVNHGNHWHGERKALSPAKQLTNNKVKDSHGKRHDGRNLETLPDLTILYDASCGLCTGIASWIARHRCRGYVRLMPSNHPSVASNNALNGFVRRRKLTVYNDKGQVFLGTKALLKCLHQISNTHLLSHLLALPILRLATKICFGLICIARHISRDTAEQRQNDRLTIRSPSQTV